MPENDDEIPPISKEEEAREAADALTPDIPEKFLAPEKRKKLEEILGSLGGATRMISAARDVEKLQGKIEEDKDNPKGSKKY